MAVEVFTVSEISVNIKKILEGNFYDIWVEGEVSNARYSSTGHLYFLLVDEKAALKCIIYKSRLPYMKFIPKNGQKIQVFGHINVYLRGGEYSLAAEDVRDVGKGIKFYNLEILKREFKKKGYLDRKRPIPEMPQRVLLFTSLTGAAIKDILNIIGRRGKNIEILIYPVTVQGDLAKKSITNALRAANHITEKIDIAILARGGGSEEDLWIFNDPDIAIALFNLKFPTISAIGHQIDITLCDLVADKRAETPSAAAEIITEKRVQLIKKVEENRKHLSYLIANILRFKNQQLKNYENQISLRKLKSILNDRIIHLDRIVDKISSSMSNIVKQKPVKLQQLSNKIENSTLSIVSKKPLYLENLSSRIHLSINNILSSKEQKLKTISSKIYLSNPQNKISLIQQKLHHYAEKLTNSVNVIIRHNNNKLSMIDSKIKALSPLSILKKGYSVTLDSKGKVIKRKNQVKKGEYIKTILHDGELVSQIREISPLEKNKKVPF